MLTIKDIGGQLFLHIFRHKYARLVYKSMDFEFHHNLLLVRRNSNKIVLHAPARFAFINGIRTSQQIITSAQALLVEN